MSIAFRLARSAVRDLPPVDIAGAPLPGTVRLDANESPYAALVDGQPGLNRYPDPQPAALLQILEEGSRRKGKWIWRCHIDLSAPYRPVWDFFEPIVNRYDAAIGPSRLATPSSTPTASCSAVTSLKPTRAGGGSSCRAARRADQSTRSSMRCTP